MRLINADALIKDITTEFEICEDILELVDAQPTIEERKKGKWIPHNEKSREYIGTLLINVDYEYWFCDTCGYRVEKGRPMYKFCPNCGADMRNAVEIARDIMHEAIDRSVWSDTVNVEEMHRVVDDKYADMRGEN